MLLKLLVLAFVGYVASQGVADSRCTQPDPVPAIRLPSETDCRRHYLCQAGLRHLMPACPTGMVFDPVSLACRTGTVCIPIPPTTVPQTTTTVPQTTTTAPATTASTVSPPTVPQDSTSTTSGTTASTSTTSGTTTTGTATTVSVTMPSALPVPPTVPSKKKKESFDFSYNFF